MFAGPNACENIKNSIYWYYMGWPGIVEKKDKTIAGPNAWKNMSFLVF